MPRRPRARARGEGPCGRGGGQHGCSLDPTLNRRYVAFKDPDRIAWELYMVPEAGRQAVLSHFERLRNRVVDAIPSAADVPFESPLSPPLRGSEPVRDFARGVLPAIKDVNVQRVIAEGAHVAVRFELDTINGLVPAFDFFRVVNGEMVEARPYNDPRPFIESVGRR